MPDPLPDPILQRVRNARRYAVGNYRYFVWPFKGLTAIEPQEFRQLINDLQPLIPDTTELLVTFMTDGCIITSALAERMQLPFQVFRDYHYHIPDAQRLDIHQKTKYFSRSLHMEKPARRNVCIIDAIISTGATIIASIDALEKAGCAITGIVTPLTKSHYGGIKAIHEHCGIMVKTLYDWREGAGDVVEVRKEAI